MRTLQGRAILIAAAIAAAPLTSTSAQNQPESGPTLEVHIRTLKHAGGVAGSAVGSDVAPLGKTVSWFAEAGRPYEGELTVCGNGVADVGTLADKLSTWAYVWQIQMVPIKYENATATFTLEWARYEGGSARPALTGKTTMTLREGDSQAIDFVRSAPGAHACAEDSAVVEVGAGYKEAADAPRSILQYDIWLKHESPSGETTRRFSAMGREGAEVGFAFAPMQFAVDPAAAQRPDVVLFTSVQGTVKARSLPGGRFQIIVDTSRRDSLGSRGAEPRGSIGNSGRKMLDVAAGEAVEIELPAPGGTSSVPGSGGVAAAPRAPSPAPTPQQAVSVVNGRVVVNNALFFQGQRTSLIVQVKPAAQQ